MIKIINFIKTIDTYKEGSLHACPDGKTFMYKDKNDISHSIYYDAHAKKYVKFL